MVNKKITFIKPQLETDAVWDPIRTCSYLGLWHMASKLKEKGHEVKYFDEVVRNEGLQRQELFQRTTTINGDITETPLNTSYETFQRQKMRDYNALTSEQFVAKYSAFKEEGQVSRTIVRTGIPVNESLELIVQENPDFVGIPLIASANYLSATRLAKEIKQRLPHTKIVFGGQHITAFPEEFLKENPYVDHVVTGDAIEVLDDLVQGKNLDKVIRGGFQTMDKFPLLDPQIIAETGYPLEPTYTFPTNGRKSVDFMFSKGCFRKCEFCVAGSQNGNHVTTTDYDLLEKQFQVFKANGIEELVVQDDAFLHDAVHRAEHLPKVLGLLKKYGFYWQNNGGVEFEGLTKEVTDQLIEYNKAGEGRITALYVPFNPRGWNKEESASKSLSERYHPNLENLKRLREEAGIYVFTSAILGTPDQTKETIADEMATDRKLIEQGYIDAALPLSATMLPGTKWYNQNGHNIVNQKDWAGYSLFTTHHSTDKLAPKDIEKAMVDWVKGLSDVQKIYKWGSAFPDA
jgi:radical SAM superfamily enzyme YgiQ (UPF0313 family)